MTFRRRRRRVTSFDLGSFGGQRSTAARRYLNDFRRRFPTLRHDSAFAGVWREIERLFALKN